MGSRVHGNGQKPPATTPAPIQLRPARQEPAPIKSGVADMRSPTAVDVTQNISINITQQAGESTQDLVRRVTDELQRQQRMGYHDHWGRV